MGMVKNALNIAKYVAYRTPLMRLLGPRYPYKITPGELAFLCDAISNTKEVGGAILEIGVAKGDTSVFLLEHLRTTGDPRGLFLIDTFSGFTPESVEHEIKYRGKDDSDMKAFSYGSEKTLHGSLRGCGYENFTLIKGDASSVEFAKYAPISVVLLDIDLYVPTKVTLENIWPHMSKPGFILVDDCLPDTPWDGALLAYQEFVAAHNLEPAIVGMKGGVIRIQ
jgi:O-methyltransferase